MLERNMGHMAFSATPDKAEAENRGGPVTNDYQPREVRGTCQEKARWGEQADKGGEPSELSN